MGPHAAQSETAVNSRRQAPGLPTETLETTAALGEPTHHATGTGRQTATESPAVTVTRSNDAKMLSWSGDSGIARACQVLTVTAKADFSDTFGTDTKRRTSLLNVESAKEHLRHLQRMCSSATFFAAAVHDTHMLTHSVERDSVSVIESFEILYALMAYPEAERHAAAEQITPLLQLLKPPYFAPALALLHKNVGSQYRSDYVAMMIDFVAQKKFKLEKRIEEPKSFADCLKRAEKTASAPIEGHSLFSYLQRLAGIPDESRHCFAEASNVVRELSGARSIPVELLHCLHLTPTLAPSWPEAARRLANHWPKARLFAAYTPQHLRQTRADLNLVHTFQIVLCRVEKFDVLPSYTKNTRQMYDQNTILPRKERDRTLIRGAVPILAHNIVRPEDTMGVLKACEVLNITRNSNFSHFRGSEGSKDIPLLDLKGAQDHLLGFQGMCSKGAVWDEAVHHTEALTHIYPRTEVSPVESLTVMHALLQFPESEQQSVTQKIRPLLAMLAPGDFAPVLSLVNKKVSPEHLKEFVETALRFAIIEKWPGDVPRSPPKTFTQWLSRASQAADAEVKGPSNFAGLQRLANMAAKDRTFLNQVCDVLKPEFDGRKVPLALLEVLELNFAMPSRWPQVAREFVEDLSKCQFYQSSDLYSDSLKNFRDFTKINMFQVYLMDVNLQDAPPVYESQADRLPGKS
jgi:hypothetical protein